MTENTSFEKSNTEEPVEKKELPLETLEKAGLKNLLLSHAANFAEKIEEPQQRFTAYIEIARQGSKEALDFALKAAEKIASPYDKCEAYINIAQEGKPEALDLAEAEVENYFQDNEKQRARESIEEIRETLKSAGLNKVETTAITKAQEKPIPIIKQAENIHSPHDRALALVKIAESRDENTETALILAQKAADQIVNQNPRAKIYAEIAKLGKPELVLTALAIADSIENHDSRIQSYGYVANAAIKIHDTDIMAEVADKLPFSFTKLKLYAELAKSGNQQFFDKALETIDQIKTPQTKAAAYIALANGLEKPEMLTKAIEEAEKIQNFQTRVNMYMEIGKNGKDDAFRRATQEAKSHPNLKLQVYAKMAEALITIGRFDEGIELTVKEKVFSDKILTLLSSAKKFKEAIKLTETIENPGIRAKFAINIVRNGCKDALSPALNAIRLVELPPSQVHLYIQLAEAGYTGALDKALKTTSEVTDIEEQYRLYIQIGKAGKREAFDLALKAAKKVPATFDYDYLDLPRVYHAFVEIAEASGKTEAIELALAILLKKTFKNEEGIHGYGYRQYLDLAKLIDEPTVQLTLNDIEKLKNELMKLPPGKRVKSYQRIGNLLEPEELTALEKSPLKNTSDIALARGRLEAFPKSTGGDAYRSFTAKTVQRIKKLA